MSGTGARSTTDAGAPAAPASPSPRLSALVASSLALAAVSALFSVTSPPGLGPIGPFVAGVLAFLGYRRVAASRGALRGPGLARAAMTAALLLLVHQAWLVVAGADVGAARVEIRRRLEEVETVLRSGTAENAWDLLAEEGRSGEDRETWVRGLRAAQARLGALRAMGELVEGGGDAGRATEEFRANPDGVATFRLAFAPEFERGRGRLETVIVVRKREGRVGASLVSLRLAPTPP